MSPYPSPTTYPSTVTFPGVDGTTVTLVVLAPPPEPEDMETHALSIHHTAPQLIDILATPGLTGPPLVPVDGQYCSIRVADGIRWTFQYNESSTSAYQWEYAGGPYHRSLAPGNQTVNSGSYVAVDPTLTIPFTGEYDIDFVGKWSQSASPFQIEIYVGNGATSSWIAAQGVQHANNSYGFSRFARLGMDAGTTLRPYARTLGYSGSQTLTLTEVEMRMIPVRIQ